MNSLTCSTFPLLGLPLRSQTCWIRNPACFPRFNQFVRFGSLASRADLQHDTKARFAAHHAVIGLSCLIERKNFVHRLHAIGRAELERIL